MIGNLIPSKDADFVALSETYIHIYMLRSLRHTYIHILPWACQTYIHTYIDTCSGFSDIHIYIHVWTLARLSEVLFLTIQKKMN